MADRQGELAGREVSRGDRNVSLGGHGVAACDRLLQAMHAPLIVVLGGGECLFPCHGCIVGRDETPGEQTLGAHSRRRGPSSSSDRCQVTLV